MELNYQPIDYRTWILGDKAREGVNIKRLNLLTPEEQKIFDTSISFHDQRKDPGHTEASLYLGFSIAQGTIARRGIFVPMITFHDDGYKGFVSSEQFREALKSVEGEKVVRLTHQITVIKRAYQILNSLGYPPEYTAEILAGISDHDTRFQEPISDNERVLHDSDIAWRFTLPCMLAYKRDASAKEILDYMQNDELEKPDRFHFPKSYEIAKIETANTLLKHFPQQAPELLRKRGFEKELEQIIAFYNQPQQNP